MINKEDLIDYLLEKKRTLENDAEDAIQEYDDEERSHACFAQIQFIDELIEHLNAQVTQLAL